MGLLKRAQPVIIRPKTEYRPRMHQYSLKPEAKEGITPVIEALKETGVIVECEELPCNTPIFPVKKAAPSTGWRMVQDLQAVNDAVIQRAPNVPDPHTLLNTLDPEAQVFTVVDISNAFFSIPVHKDSQNWFAFTFEGKRYTFTRLPQGYSESPTIFSQAMMVSISAFEPPQGSQLLVYVDDILVASRTEEQCKEDTLALLKHQHEEGHKVSKQKLQPWRGKVKYLGHELTGQGRTVLEDRKAAVLQAPKPATKKRMISCLGLTNYCRAWIPHYAEITEPLQQLMHAVPLEMRSILTWNHVAEEVFCEQSEYWWPAQFWPYQTIRNHSSRWLTVRGSS